MATTPEPEQKWEKIKSGLLSGVGTSLITQPLEVIKTTIMVNPSRNRQLEANNPLSSLRAAIIEVYNYKDRGTKNFFRGTVIATVRQSLGFGLYSFLLSELNAYIIPPQVRDPSNSIYLLYGVSAFATKIAAVCITSPLGLLKTRRETLASENTSLMIITREILAKEHIKGLYRGTISIVWREAIYSFIQYPLYKKLKDSFKGNISPIMNSFISPFAAGILAITISHPFEVVRNRMQASNQYLEEFKIYSGPINAFKKIYKTEGVPGYFRGFLPRLVRKPINSGVTWLLYDLFLAKFAQKPHQ